MARAVVLVFDDNAAAEKLAKDWNNLGDYFDGWSEPNSEVVGLFAVPTQFCPNSGSGGCSTNKRVRAWSRGKKFGWWVCSICKKPSGFVPPDKRDRPELWRRVISQGVNLLFPPEDQHIESPHDEGWGAYREGVLR